MKNTLFKIMLSLATGFYGAQASAKLQNGGIYVSKQNAVPGSVLSLHGTVYSDAVQSNVTVTLGFHRVDGNFVASSPSFSLSYAGQNFSAGQRLNYVTKYTIPSNLQNGTYILVMKAGSAPGRSEFLLAQNPKSYPVSVTGCSSLPPVVVSPTPTPAPAPVDAAPGSLLNAGIYIPNKSVQAGASIKIHNGVVALKAVDGVSLKMDLRRILDSGAIDSAAIVSKSYSGLSFYAGEQKTYVLDYPIPSSVVGGRYILAVEATNAARSVNYLSFNTSADINTITVSSGNASLERPTPTRLPASTPVMVPVPAAPTPVPSVPPVSNESYLRGINIMDAGIGPHSNPGVSGTQYTTPTLGALQALKGRGLGVIRLPIMWERMQKSLGGPLDPTFLGEIMQVLRDANTAGLKIILDVHNYAAYTSGGTARLFGQPGGPTKEQFGDLWRRMAIVIKADAAAYNSVYAYDLMNEPHDLPTANGVPGNKIWEQYAQAAVSAIRATGDNKLIHVEGYGWASPVQFPIQHPNPFINDPANNIMYQAHSYMDNNAGGVYTESFAAETNYARSQGHASVAARGIARIKAFSDWCAAKQQRCFLGEYGWPNSATVGTSEANQWNAAGEQVLQFLDSIKMGATMWATGSWLGPAGNIMNTYTLPGRSNSGFSPLSQAPILEAHPGK